ncbi:MAG: hypothetical protein RR623_02315 [Bacilli bacterium]
MAFLSLSLHNASKNVAKEDGDIPMIYNSNIIDVWFFITGLLVPAIILFKYSVWYLALIYLIVGLLITMILANQYMYKFHVIKRPPLFIPGRADARPSIIINVISIIVLTIIVL